MVYEYTLMIVLLSFCGSEIQVSRQHMLWGPQFYSCLSNLIWILKIIETNESCFIFLFFYSLVVSDITYNTKDIHKLLIFTSISRGVARYKMKCRHNLLRGVWGPLKAPRRSRAEPWRGFKGGRGDPQRKTILSVNRCTNGEIGTIKDMKYILILSWKQNIYRSC